MSWVKTVEGMRFGEHRHNHREVVEEMMGAFVKITKWNYSTAGTVHTDMAKHSSSPDTMDIAIISCICHSSVPSPVSESVSREPKRHLGENSGEMR